MKSLTIRNLSKTYFDLYAGTHVTAVHDVSLEVQRGRVRLHRRSVGLRQVHHPQHDRGLHPDHRRRDSGRRAAGEGSGPGPRRRVPVVRAVPWRTVLDNVAFGPKMRGIGKAEREKIAHEYLALAKLSEAAERYPNELSGGMQQRVGVVRALANEPDVLLMDEPFASVDAQTRMTLQEELTRIWQEKRPTVIFITHDVAEAVFLANRVVALSKGRVLEEIAVDLPRPRSWDALHEDDAVQGADRPGAATRAFGLSHVAGRAQIAQDPCAAGGRGLSISAWQLWLTVAAPGRSRASQPAPNGSTFWSRCRSRRSDFMSSCSRLRHGCREHKITPLKFGE